MRPITITTISEPVAAVEIVERKGIGHPDTICDALAEELSRALSRFYLERFGLVLHHNVDKALLWGGSSRPRFGGGEILAPMEIFLAGRATLEYRGIRVPLEELVRESSLNWLNTHLHALDPQRHVKLHSLIRPGSPDLVELYLRQEQTGMALANDTSCGVGYAPLSELERVVLAVERHLNAPGCKARQPAFGEDIKVMGIARGGTIQLTIACAFVDAHVADADDYLAHKARLVQEATQAAGRESSKPLGISVNAADDVAKGSLYLTVTGTSAESGDDGEVGRGNRVNGLISPYRPMNMEAAAGKNPVTHVGKLYNIVAQRIAAGLVRELDAVRQANCYLVSQIGAPISEPLVIDIRLELHEGAALDALKAHVEQIAHAELGSMAEIRRALLEGEITVY
jgi:S-adenosylmethionine synthetase